MVAIDSTSRRFLIGRREGVDVSEEEEGGLVEPTAWSSREDFFLMVDGDFGCSAATGEFMVCQKTP